MPDSDEIRACLVARLAELSARTERIEVDLRQPLDDDFAQQAIDREDDEALDALERAALAEIELTEKALLRLEAGTYGTCTTCGGEIARKRLEVLPAAADCIDCADAKRQPGSE